MGESGGNKRIGCWVYRNKKLGDRRAWEWEIVGEEGWGGDGIRLGWGLWGESI